MATELLFDKNLLIPLAGMLVGVVGIMLPVAIIWTVFHFRQRKTEALYATVKHLADKGQPIPPELLDPPQAVQERAGDTPLIRALTTLGAGVGLGLMFWIMGVKFLIGIGVLVACIGIAQLLALLIERRKPAAMPSPPQAL
jgi:Flp pilus assembly protein TadB